MAAPETFWDESKRLDRQGRPLDDPITDAFPRGHRHSTGRSGLQRPASRASGAVPGGRRARKRTFEFPILKKSDGIFRERCAVKYAWITRHRHKWPITLQCGVLGVSASGYFAQVADPDPSASSEKGRRLSDEAVLAHIKAAHAESKGAYGWPRLESIAGKGSARRQRAYPETH